ncbi:hypothetical protein DYBT9275_00785 [Dyadobacter sp. CECT 9275]|uniref:Sialate O-acetylesterase domain-containing protein n=1 Tax=Dyadobacter helix TaxID=2822344 RepID=A0A916N4H2_9BACT|nr:sialate O-acetylesterase [Dyadobacter sp. CECT 9275]CAG4991588.1 hypothetical protein DYBT9275_00785 [Dyadobacter sp. CECT 9275]
MVSAKRIFTTILLCFLLLQYTWAENRITLPYFFSDNMVLQRQKPIKFWGNALPGSTFSASFGGESKKVKTQPTGKWAVTFSAKEAGGPYELKIDSDSSFSLKNILIGDVWLCSGQSNMEWTVKQVFNAPYELKNANFPQIRSFTVSKEIRSEPVDNTSPAAWQMCTPQNTASFSAVAYFFARDIHLSQHIPIGIIHTSWGGTAIEPWISLASMEQHPDFKELAATLSPEMRAQKTIEASQKTYAHDMQFWQKALEKQDPGFTEKWYTSADKAQNWKTLVAPDYWENNGLPDFDGLVWLRKQVNIPASLAGKPLLMNLETLKDFDITYFNGIEIGKGTWQPGRRIYVVPGELVKEGTNLVAIRLENTGGPGGFTSRHAIDLRLQEMVESENPLIVPLSGEWQFRSSLKITEYPAKPADPAANRRMPSVIYNAMIAPFHDLGLTGFLWYQGEANTSEAGKYRKLLPLLIEDWRKQFKQPDLTFLITQLSGYGALTNNPVESTWAELREAQESALKISKTGMAVTYDVGNPYDVHPVYKQQVGQRMAAEAKRTTYGESSLQTSPLYDSMLTEGKSIRIRFRYAANGLKTRNGALKGFAIAGGDGKFVWANARIEGNEVIVWNDQISVPRAVRYAWAASPLESNGANLYNTEGFPASPFRTDSPYQPNN